MEKRSCTGQPDCYCESCETTDSVAYFQEYNSHLCTTCANVIRDFLLKTQPSSVIKYLNRFVIGQDEAKRTLAYLVLCYSKMGNANKPMPKTNLLMVGPTGTGKTLLAETIANYLEVPYVIADMTKYTQSGYVGRSIEEILGDLLVAANNNYAKAERGVVVLDEFDKIARLHDKKEQDINGKAVQQELLKILDGSIVPLGYVGRGDLKSINTKSMLFICTGAFNDLDEVVRQRLNKDKRKIGFNSQEEKDPKEESKEVWKQVTHDDLIAYGMMPELMGRIPNIVTLDEMTKEMLIRILMEAENSPIYSYKNLFETMDIELEFLDEALGAIADRAIEMSTGARSLNTIIQSIMRDITIDISEEFGAKKCIITEGTVTKGEEPRIIYEKARNVLAYNAVGR